MCCNASSPSTPWRWVVKSQQRIRTNWISDNYHTGRMNVLASMKTLWGFQQTSTFGHAKNTLSSTDLKWRNSTEYSDHLHIQKQLSTPIKHSDSLLVYSLELLESLQLASSNSQQHSLHGKKKSIWQSQLLCGRIATCHRDVCPLQRETTLQNVTTPQLQPALLVVIWRLTTAATVTATARLISRRWTLGTIFWSMAIVGFGTAFSFGLLAVVVIGRLRRLRCFTVVLLVIHATVAFQLFVSVVALVTAGAASFTTAWMTFVVALATRATLLTVAAVTMMGPTPTAVSVFGVTPASWWLATSVWSASWTRSTVTKTNTVKLYGTQIEHQSVLCSAFNCNHKWSYVHIHRPLLINLYLYLECCIQLQHITQGKMAASISNVVVYMCTH